MEVLSQSKDDLHVFLCRYLANEMFQSDPPVLVPQGNDTSKFINLMKVMIPHFLGRFPTTGIWEKDLIEFSEVLLDVLERGLVRLQGLFDGESCNETRWLFDIIVFIGVMNTWNRNHEVSANGLSSPTHLGNRALDCAIIILCTLGTEIQFDSGIGRVPPPWVAFRRSLLQLAAIHKNVSYTTNRTFPFTIEPDVQSGEKSAAGEIKDPPVSLIIHSKIEAEDLSAVIMKIVCMTYSKPIRCLSSSIDLFRYFYESSWRRLCSICQDGLVDLGSPASSQTWVSLHRLLESITVIRAELFSFPASFSHIIHSAIWARANAGPSEGSSLVDDILLRWVADFSFPPVAAIHVLRVAEALRDEEWPDPNGNSLRVLLLEYLSKTLRASSSPGSLAVKHVLELRSLPRASQYERLITELHGATDPQNPSSPVSNFGKRKRQESQVWASGLEAEFRRLLPIKSCLDKDLDTLSLIRWLLDEVYGVLSRPLQDPSARFRIDLAQSMERAAEMFASCPSTTDSIPHAMDIDHGDSTFPMTHRIPLPKLLPVLFTTTTRLIDGPLEEVTNLVRRKAYRILILGIHYGVLSEVPLTRVSELVKRGMEHSDRTVRMEAGRACGAYLEVCSSMPGDNAKTAGALLDLVMALTEVKDPRVVETTVTTVGKMGRVTKGSTLGRIILILISQWGQSNSLLKSLSYIQLRDLAQVHNKSSYAFLSPFLPDVIKYVTANICNKPALLGELGRFLSLEPAELLAFTLSYSLPSLVATCSRDEIRAVSHQVGRPVAALLIDKTAVILKAVFLLPDGASTEQALRFMTRMVAEAAGARAGSVGIQALVNSSIAELLAELVILLGSEEHNTAVMASKALRRVQKALTLPDQLASTSSMDSPTLGAFLQPHILAIMTYLNEVLQEVQGKKTPAFKAMVIRSLGMVISEVGSPVTAIAPQIMAAIQTHLLVSELTEASLSTWKIFMTKLVFRDIGPYIGSTAASFVTNWHHFSPLCQRIARETLEYLIVENAENVKSYLNNVVSLSSISELSHCAARLEKLEARRDAACKLDNLLERCSSENVTISSLSLVELKQYLVDNDALIRRLASGDHFDSTIASIVKALFNIASKDGDTFDGLRLLAYECIGLLGALDPFRFETPSESPPMIVLHNFEEQVEASTFALHLIQHLLVDAFRSTSDLRYQSHLAFAIQELLKFCGFTSDLIKNEKSVPVKTRARWKSLPVHLLDAITPLLEGRFSHEASDLPGIVHPIYQFTTSYREWLQNWVTDMVGKTRGADARTIFNSCRLAIRSQDVQVARFLVPHLVLNVLISGNDDDKQAIRSEIIAVLEDQAAHQDGSMADRRVLSAQTVFHLMDHMCTWIRVARRHITEKRLDNRRSRTSGADGCSDLEMQVMAVDSMISSLNQELLATAALNCKSYARALMTIEQLIQVRSEAGAKRDNLQPYLERLHLIYANLDEPDGMEGVSTRVLSPSLEHEIREHESTGRWTSAQSCWEVRLQQSPDDVELHIGLLRCLRNLGHYDTLRTHITGILTRYPEWEYKLAGYHAESAWMIGDWDAVGEIVQRVSSDLPELVIARLLLSLRGDDDVHIIDGFRHARRVLGASITSAGKYSYRRTYDAVINLHVVHELEMIHDAKTVISRRHSGSQAMSTFLQRTKSSLSARLEQTLPTFKTREPILSMRRTALGLRPGLVGTFKIDLGRAWLASSKMARKAGHFQTAYTSMLQARQLGTPYSFIQSCKLIHTEGDALRALQELNNALKDPKVDTVTTPTGVSLDVEEQMLQAKALLLRARWTHETRRSDSNDLLTRYTEASEIISEWESPYFYLGAYQDELFKASSDPRIRGSRARHQACKCYIRALMFGSKFVYQAMPRLLTIWLDNGADPELVEVMNSGIPPRKEEDLVILYGGQQKLNKSIEDAIGNLPTYQWFTAFPQIVSRIGHPNAVVYGILATLISHVLHSYPQQALWFFTAVVNSQKTERRKRGRAIIDRVKSRGGAADRTSTLVDEWLLMTQELLAICNKDVKGAKQKEGEDAVVDLQILAPLLYKLAPCSLIIPLQNSLTVTVPSAAQLRDIHKPFSLNPPTFHQFVNDLTLMASLVRPRKFTVIGSDGVRYHLLAKPKDDMRKDSRLMDFNSMINKMLKINSESRKRQLHIRTYGVIPLNEECGLIEWVNNTRGLRHILKELYDARGIALLPKWVPEVYEKAKRAGQAGCARSLVEEILPKFPPVFHEWFIATFPEPSAWLASRLRYGRTLAVMSMIGFILGLGDRHGENILFDSVTGDTVHVDFNCIFDKGRNFEIPEVVPFRLTQNLVDGFGVMGVEGVYRRACEVTMQLLRDNKDSLMSVLEAFTHDPILEWESEQKLKERVQRRHQTFNRRGDPDVYVPQLKDLAQRALDPIQRRLSGSHTFQTEYAARISPISTANQVEQLIKDATNPGNLGRMYIGWAAWL